MPHHLTPHSTGGCSPPPPAVTVFNFISTTYTGGVRWLQPFASSTPSQCKLAFTHLLSSSRANSWRHFFFVWILRFFPADPVSSKVLHTNQADISHQQINLYKLCVTVALFIPGVWYIKTSGNTNKCTILQSVHSFYYTYLAPTYFGIVANLKNLTPRFY